MGRVTLALALSCAAIAVAEGQPAPLEANAASVAPAPGDRAQGAVPGLLRLRDGFLLHTAFLLPTPPPTRLLPAGRGQVEFELAVANTFTRSNAVQVALEGRSERGPVTEESFRRIAQENPEAEPLFLLDGEVQRGELRFRRGFAHGLEAELTLAMLNVQGGRIDALAEGFHSLLGIDQDGRQNVVRDGYLVYLELADGAVLRDRAPGPSLGDAVVTVRKASTSTLRQGRLRQAPRRTILFEGSTKLPLGDTSGLVSSGSIDFGMQGMVAVCAWYFCGYGGLGVRHLGAWRALDVGEQTVIDGVTAVERRYPGSTSLIYQIAFAQSPLRALGLANLAEDSYRFSFGIKRSLEPGRSLVLAVTENFAHFDNGSDITFHFGWTQGLSGGSLSGPH